MWYCKSVESIDATMSCPINIVILMSVLALGVVGYPSGDSSCDSGPDRYYDDIECKPAYHELEDCIYRYACIGYQDPKRCYLHGFEYPIGTVLKNPTYPGITCTCVKRNERVYIDCQENTCDLPPVEPGCYRQRNATSECPGPKKCPASEKERPTCNVEGKIYKDGEFFRPDSDPRRRCYCGPDYVGKNISPFCKKPKGRLCDIELSHSEAIVKGCVPVFEQTNSTRASCPTSFRCPKPTDKLGERLQVERKRFVECKFGALTMAYGDVIAPGKDEDSHCVRCICRVGPVPNCRRQPADICK